MASQDTKTLILDASEALFSKHSYVDVTFRQIARKAGVHVSQITYHFQSKDRVLGEVINRRAAELNEERMAMLSAYQRVVGKHGMEIEPLVRAFFDPFFEKLTRADNEGWRNYGALVGRIVWDPSALPVLNTAYNEVARHFLEAFIEAAPEIEEEHIHRAFQFLLSAMYSAGADNRRIDNLSDGKYTSRDVDRIYEIIVPFVTGGFRALAHDELARTPVAAQRRGDAA